MIRKKAGVGSGEAERAASRQSSNALRAPEDPSGRQAGEPRAEDRNQTTENTGKAKFAG